MPLWQVEVHETKNNQPEDLGLRDPNGGPQLALLETSLLVQLYEAVVDDVLALGGRSFLRIALHVNRP